MLQILLLSALLKLGEEGHKSNSLLQKKRDFTLVFDGHEIACHKHILAASSPVLRAMVDNQHIEAIQSQSCKMSQIWQIYIYLCKILGGWGKSVGEHAVVLDKVAFCVNYNIL